MKALLVIILLIFSYLLGNISPSTFLAKASGHDIKSEGSGNAGTTNALRVLGTKAAVVTLIIDVAKGFLAVIISGAVAGHFFANHQSALAISAWCGLAVFLGHVWPILLKFQGGKGVATGLGVLLAYNWKIALLALLVFIIVVAITRYVALGSMLAALAFAIFNIKMVPFIIMVIILIYKHRENIVRMRAGEEKIIKFGPHGKIEFVDPEIRHE